MLQSGLGILVCFLLIFYNNIFLINYKKEKTQLLKDKELRFFMNLL